VWSEDIGTAPTNKVVGATRHCRPYLGWIVAAAFTISGTIHIIHPTTFTSIVPHFLPLRTELVYASGGAELICAAGLWRRDRWAGIAATVLLIVVWPANLQDAITAQNGHNLATQVIDWVRFPLQIPLIWFALQSGTRPSPNAKSARSGRVTSRHAQSG
jgi:uncharacterized membrane protein